MASFTHRNASLATTMPRFGSLCLAIVSPLFEGLVGGPPSRGPPTNLLSVMVYADGSSGPGPQRMRALWYWYRSPCSLAASVAPALLWSTSSPSRLPTFLTA